VPFGRRLLGTLALLALTSAPAHAAGLLRPTSAVQGTVRMSWSWTSDAGGQTTTSTGALRFDVRDRAPGTAALLAWVPGEFPPWATAPQRRPGLFLRAQVTVERFRETTAIPCGEEGTVTQTTELLGGGPVNGLLMLDEPEVDARRGTGRIDVDPAWVVQRDGIFRGGAKVVGTGAFTARVSRANCGNPEPYELPVSGVELMGPALPSLTDAVDDVPLRVTPDGGLVVRRTVTVDVTGRRGTPLGKVTLDADLRLAGPLGGHGGFCRVITPAEAAGLLSAADAQRLGRRRGFPRVWIGTPALRRTAPPGARYEVQFGGGQSAPCGAPLGSRASPALRPVRG
jgi:hypothetical protein